MSGTPISPVGASRPELTLSPAAINSEPVELDGNPTSPEKVKADLHGSQQAKLEELSPEEREKRAKLISDRKKDAAVLVDLPQTPGAEEFTKSEDASATISDKTAMNRSS